MPKPESLTDYMILTRALTDLEYTLGQEHMHVTVNIARASVVLSRIEMVAENNELHSLLAKLNSDAPPMEEQFRGAQLSEHYVDEITGVIRRINDRLQYKFEGVKILRLEDNSITTTLRALREVTEDQTKLTILDETIRCLEAGVCRAAIVLGWNLAYEHLRRWIYESKNKSKVKRLKLFNDVLTTKHASPTKFHDPTKDYEDFLDHGERRVIDWAYEAKLFRKQTHQVFIDRLNTRNRFAHPSTRKATQHSATGYIDDLIVNVLNDEQFT